MKIREIINKHWNLWVGLPQETKKHYFPNLNVKYLSNNNNFWETIKPYFSNKGLNSNKILFKEKGELVSNKIELASIMKKCSSILQKGLYLKEDKGGPSIILNYVLKNLFFTRVLIRLEKLNKTIKSFPPSK